jgi:hypothetical protein
VESLKRLITEQNEPLEEDEESKNKKNEALAKHNKQNKKRRETTNNTNSRENIKDKGDEEYGFDEINYKLKHTLRVCFININGIPKSANHPKNKEIYNTIDNNDIDIVGMSETNTAWNKMSQRGKWKERTLGWWESAHTSIAYNVKDTVTNIFQPGGTMLISRNKISHRVCGQENDTYGLGR